MSVLALIILILGAIAMLISAWKHRQLTQSCAGDEPPPEQIKAWNFHSEASIVLILTFASLFFAKQFLLRREHIMSCSILMAMLSIFGSHNRLRIALHDLKLNEKMRRNTLRNHLFFCCAMGLFMGGILILLFD